MRLRMDHPAWARVGLVASVAIVMACYLGGVAATNLSPTTVETSNYRATVRLDPVPRHTAGAAQPDDRRRCRPRVHVARARPRARRRRLRAEEVTDLLTGGPVSVRSSSPRTRRSRQRSGRPPSGRGWRFALGRSSWPSACRWPCTMPGVDAGADAPRPRGRGSRARLWWHWPEHGADLPAGPLRGVHDDRPARHRAAQPGLLADVETRAEQATPYLRNLLALSQALQEKFVPTDLTQPTVSARFLLVSDIHGANQYALMRTIIEEEGVDAVIDAGDLINFGRVQEGEAAGIFRGIESLECPTSSPAATTTNRQRPTGRCSAMSAVPNVVLLQDPDGVHRELSFHGLRITGFNDPRYFGDDNEDGRARRPAVDAYNEALEAEPESDLVVTHEPYAATEVARGRVVVNGHIHTPTLDGPGSRSGPSPAAASCRTSSRPRTRS